MKSPLLTTLLLPLSLSLTLAANLPENGGFEDPPVSARATIQDGGDPTNGGSGPGWSKIRPKKADSLGEIVLGLTNEVAHSGKQSLFVEFNHFLGGANGAALVSEMLPVQPGQDYLFSIWNRLDANSPVTTSGTAILKINIGYFTSDATPVAGKSLNTYAPLAPGRGNAELSAQEWSVIERKAPTPADAAFARITLIWQSDAAEVTGTVFFDDVALAIHPK
jgi:hypothetical protein